MAKGGFGTTAPLCDSKANCIAIAIYVEAMQGLEIARRIALSPQLVARPRIVDASGTLKRGNDRFLAVKLFVVVMDITKQKKRDNI